jgi:hypothetical protein
MARLFFHKAEAQIPYKIAIASNPNHQNTHSIALPVAVFLFETASPYHAPGLRVF